ncbi:four-carbon acid sugar kinase family protein [Paraburkholderia sabiae]|uniref:Four-carbon acid sugar kinase family protein n=1 Tax=Paraburkholderia sabiae TaxID=273251 RepID=A0ABU9QAM2_9BURK|nr:four-carbon acid sugar kinase family protein [Paraburkholderia sabiae]WJZ75459.1 four-carbon acid sugar kinase family protein [Paraburkholderia sabiae]CAD6535214.1 D-threonate kinase [Paraburkholderia sabiae]
MRIRIITDDFTSALDGTACFAERGWNTAALLRPEDTENVTATAVVSLDTDTRERVAAGDPVADAARAWCHADVLVLQFDSTLRGHVAKDCVSARAASGRRKLLIAPAFPSAGRTTEAGRVLVDGVPVHKTAFGRDPTLPVLESSVPALFLAQGLPVVIARDAAQAKVLLEEHDAVVMDTRAEDDLDALVGLFAGSRDLLLAGSTGLLRALARALSQPEPIPQLAALSCDAPWLVVGSLNPSSRRQLNVARESRRINVLATGSDRLPGAALAEAALRDLVTQVTNLIASGACDGLVVTGGETARRIVDSLPAVSLRVHREILPGVPLVEVRSSKGSFPMITKAGGFGGDDALLICLDALTGARV